MTHFINNRFVSGMFKINITYESELAVLKTMDIDKGMGSDKIRPIFPNQWKIVPTFKAGSNMKIENYRGVNVVSNLAKSFEKITYSQVKLMIMPRLSNNQYGLVTLFCETISQQRL